MDKEGEYLITYVMNEALLNAMIRIPNNAAQCWLNSLIQLLISLPAFNKSVGAEVIELVNMGYSGKILSEQNPLASFYSTLIVYLEQQIRENPGTSFFTMANGSDLMNNFNKAFNFAHPSKYGYDLAGQQDLFEIFSLFLDYLNIDKVCAKFLNVQTRRFHCKCGAVKKITSHNFFVNMAGFDFDKMKTSEEWVGCLNKNEISCGVVACSSCPANMDRKIAKERCKRRSEILLLQVNTFAKKNPVSNIPRELMFVADNNCIMKYKLITVVHHRANNDSTKSGHYWVNTVSHMDNLDIKRMIHISDVDYHFIEKADTIMPTTNTAYLLAYHLHDILTVQGNSAY